MSGSSIRRKLLNDGYKRYRPPKKPKLIEAMRNKLLRLQWTKQLQDWTHEEWSRVCFTYESTIEIMKDNSRFVRRKPNEEFKP